MQMFRTALQRNGFSVLEATSVDEAYNCFRQHASEVDLLIADLVLPDGSGIHVALHCWSQLPRLRTILTSGYPISMWSDQDTAELNELPSGSVAILQKPFTPAKLVEIVKGLLTASGRR